MVSSIYDTESVSPFKMKEIWHIVLYIIGALNFAGCQFLSFASSIKKPAGNLKSSTCNNNTIMVEQFFNVIFNEFHSTPPVCVCVKMCPEQPTYCYPNGCLKISPDIKKDKVIDPVSNHMPVARKNDNRKALKFYVDEKSGLLGDFMEKQNDDVKIVKTEKALIKKLRPDPFKDRYKLFFKSKRAPKVELKYHHAEQAKNMKSDLLKIENIDVSNTRWPSNKNRRSNQRIYLDHPKVINTLSDNSDWHTPSLHENTIPVVPTKYFKRELSKNTNKEINDNKTKAGQLQQNLPNNNTVSLESLLMYIENNISPKDTLDLSREASYEDKETKGISDPNVTLINVNLTFPKTEMTDILSMNFTIENIDRNMYLDGNTKESKTQTDSEMIAAMSRKIDVQNNTSLEMMKRITGNVDGYKGAENHIEETTKVLTTENVITSIDDEPKSTKRSKLRLSRKLHIRKKYQVHY